MTPAYRKVYHEVQRLVGQCNYRGDRNFIERPPGWQHLNVELERAVVSGLRAMRFYEPNYPRLVLARDELLQVA